MGQQKVGSADKIEGWEMRKEQSSAVPIAKVLERQEDFIRQHRDLQQIQPVGLDPEVRERDTETMVETNNQSLA